MDSKRLDPRLIVKLPLSINTVSMHSTRSAIANTLIELFSSPACAEALIKIRNEINSTPRESDGAWTKSAVAKLQHIDSTISESMCYSGFGIAAQPRIVAHSNGIDVNGYSIPQGIKRERPAYAIFETTAQGIPLLDSFIRESARLIPVEPSNSKTNFSGIGK